MPSALSTPTVGAGARDGAGGQGKAPVEQRKRTTGRARNQSSRTYLKVSATFQCNKIECKKMWSSVHVWDDEVNCEFCGRRAKLVNAKDELMEIDTYRCSESDCNNTWKAIHDEQEQLQACDDCGSKVMPDGDPQKRYGRHSWYECKNKKCQGPAPVAWEDFSVDPPKAQKCAKCHNAGSILKLTKVRPFFRRRSSNNNNDENKAPTATTKIVKTSPQAGRSSNNNNDENKAPTATTKIVKTSPQAGRNGSGDSAGPGPAADKRSRSPPSQTTHDPALCDMCQDIILQNKGKSCHKLRKIVCVVQKNAEGIVEEKIVETV